MNSSMIKTSLVSNGPGFLQIPSVDFDGNCNDNNYANFEENRWLKDTDSTCLRKMSSIEKEFKAQCLYQQSMAKYVTDLWIAKYFFVTLSSVLLSDLFAFFLSALLFCMLLCPIFLISALFLLSSTCFSQII
jgi:hypothetical protein